MNIEITFTNYLAPEYDALEDKFKQLSSITFKYLSLTDDFIFEVDLISAEKIQDINKKYRNIDKVTDVISFAFEDNEEYINHDIPRVLGEIFICVDKAIEQSKLYKHSFDREISFLFVHGLLHLLGYDHQTEEEKKIMFNLQEEILKKVNL